jgi:hypothetical protein
VEWSVWNEGEAESRASSLSLKDEAILGGWVMDPVSGPEVGTCQACQASKPLFPGLSLVELRALSADFGSLTTSRYHLPLI